MFKKQTSNTTEKNPATNLNESQNPTVGTKDSAPAENITTKRKHLQVQNPLEETTSSTKKKERDAPHYQSSTTSNTANYTEITFDIRNHEPIVISDSESDMDEILSVKDLEILKKEKQKEFAYTQLQLLNVIEHQKKERQEKVEKKKDDKLKLIEQMTESNAQEVMSLIFKNFTTKKEIQQVMAIKPPENLKVSNILEYYIQTIKPHQVKQKVEYILNSNYKEYFRKQSTALNTLYERCSANVFKTTSSTFIEGFLVDNRFMETHFKVNTEEEVFERIENVLDSQCTMATTELLLLRINNDLIKKTPLLNFYFRLNSENKSTLDDTVKLFRIKKVLYSYGKTCNWLLEGNSPRFFSIIPKETWKNFSSAQLENILEHIINARGSEILKRAFLETLLNNKEYEPQLGWEFHLKKIQPHKALEHWFHLLLISLRLTRNSRNENQPLARPQMIVAPVQIPLSHNFIMDETEEISLEINDIACSTSLDPDPFQACQIGSSESEGESIEFNEWLNLDDAPSNTTSNNNNNSITPAPRTFQSHSNSFFQSQKDAEKETTNTIDLTK